MIRYVAGRFLWAVPMVFGITTLIFVLLELAPGDPANLYIGRGMTAETIEQIRTNLGLDQPAPVRYGRWLASAARGDLGISTSRNAPVTSVIAAALPNTLMLAGVAFAAAFLLGILLGVIQAVRQYSLLDSVLSAVALFFYSMPSFWLALMLVLTFSLAARNVWDWPIWFPASAVVSVDHEFMSLSERIVDRLRHLFLPALTLTLVLAAGVARFMRGSMLEVIRQDYVRTARAKGLPESRVVFKHALRNALIPIATLAGLYLPFLFSGAVFIETVFAWPGMGRLIVDAITARDYPVVMGASMAFATMVVVGNLLADLLYAVIDPRIRHGRT